MVKVIFVVGRFTEDPQLKYLKICSSFYIVVCSRYRSKVLRRKDKGLETTLNYFFQTGISVYLVSFMPLYTMGFHLMLHKNMCLLRQERAGHMQLVRLLLLIFPWLIKTFCCIFDWSVCI